jgi:hypothetical protein
MMTVAITFMLWLAFRDSGEAELREMLAEADVHARPDLLHDDNT